MLFEKGDIEVNPKSHKGNAPLTDSIISHHSNGVRLLCAHLDVDLDSRDNEGRDLFSLVKLEQESLSRYKEDDPSKETSSKKGSGVSAAEATLRLEECLEHLRTAIETRAQNRSGLEICSQCPHDSGLSVKISEHISYLKCTGSGDGRRSHTRVPLPVGLEHHNDQ